MDVHGDRCERCWFTRVDFEDDIAPKVCAGKPPQPGDVVHENSRNITVHLWFQGEFSNRYMIAKRGDVSAQWRTVKQMIADHEKCVLTEKFCGPLRTIKVKASGEWVVPPGFYTGRVERRGKTY